MGLSDDRKAMTKSLQGRMVPLLRESGFRGSFPHFRRFLPDRIDLLTVRFDKWGGGFVVEISKAPAGVFQTSWGETIQPQDLKAHHLPPDQRFRLGAKQPGGDYWFRYDGGWFRRGRSFDKLTDHVCALIASQAEEWWSGGS